jgi:hypothetical protein
MSFFDSGLINFIKLLIIVGLVSMIYMIIMQKIKEQNHKISSLLSLVTTMAHEITSLKHEPVVITEEKNEISDDETECETDSDSDSDTESIDLEEIDLVKGDKITMLETSELEIDVEDVEDVEIAEIAEIVEVPNVTPEVTMSVKKMNTSQLINLVVSKNLKSKSVANKMKKKELLELVN